MLNRKLFLIPALLSVLLTATPALAQVDTQAVPQSREQIQLSFAPLVKKVAPAVVNIYTKRIVASAVQNPLMADPLFRQLFGNRLKTPMRQHMEASLGSGAIVEAGGLIVTNAHVIEGAAEIVVILADGREFPARIALVDHASDLALLRVDPGAEPLPFLKLKPSESLEVGDLVLAVGNPFGVGQTVTSGIVSAQGRSSLDINDFNFFIQTDAAINPGNSGGPLVALDGGVVGINTAIFSRSGGSLGIGFAIPSEMVATVIAAERNGQKGDQGVIRPWLGVNMQSITPEIAGSLGLPRPGGALIADLHPASPLLTAGAKVGDAVVAVSGYPIRDAAEMKFRMATVPVGKTAAFKILRDGQTLDIKVAAIAPPDDPPRQETLLKGRHLLGGVTIANLNPAVATEIDYNGREQGVVVLKVPQSSYMHILSPGDIILEINGTDIKTVSDVLGALENIPAGARGVSLTILSNGRVSRIIMR
ncbi:MAG: Do family serine endopeptidase [Alphaproteobacteria bacterium]|nr:Do family serine endopeptidase [Alphaproteobacteria bacterium]